MSLHLALREPESDLVKSLLAYCTYRDWTVDGTITENTSPEITVERVYMGALYLFIPVRCKDKPGITKEHLICWQEQAPENPNRLIWIFSYNGQISRPVPVRLNQKYAKE